MSVYPPLKYLTGAKPNWLTPVDTPASEEEVEHAKQVRADFFRDTNRNPYMVDIVRAFRLAKGASSYVEVGSRDKGNIAWASHILAPNAKILDIDLENDKVAEQRVRSYIPSTQQYLAIEGNSISHEISLAADEYIGKGSCDIIFIDSNHMYFHFLNEFDIFMEILRPGGFLLVHDVLWEGTSEQKGKALACELIDRHMPVYLVNRNFPVTRYFRMQKNSPTWGGVGIIRKPD